MGLIPQSSVGKKLVSSVTGLGLFVFICLHLSENLLLLANDPDLFNNWAHTLQSFGPLLRLIEIGLLLFFLYHIVTGVMVAAGKRAARGKGYAVQGWAGKPSRKSPSSQSMIVTGLVLMVFVIWHVYTFRFGPSIEDGYVTTLADGKIVHDLYRIVTETFSNPVNVTIYVLVMFFLGFHLRHGFWSAFQSLGAYHPRWTPVLYGLGAVFAVLLALGFIVIPIWVYAAGV